MMPLLRHVIVGLLFCGAHGLADPVYACSCNSLAPCQALWRRDAAPAVFEATVVSIERTVVEHGMMNGERITSSGTTTVHLKDIRNLLGEGATTIETPGSGASCGYTFKIGQRYVIDAYRGSGTLSTGLCSQTKPIEQAGALLAYIESLSRPSPGATVTGTVTAGAMYLLEPVGPQRQGLGGAKVTVDGPVSRTATTASDGTFSFDRLPTGRYRVGIQPPDGTPYEAPPARDVDLPHAHACHTAQFSLRLNAMLEGTVVDTAGRPVRNASVALRRTDALTAPRNPRSSTFVGYATTRSDESGRYVFPNLGPGQYVVGVNIDSGPTHGSPYRPAFLAGQDGEPDVIDFPLGGHRLLPPVVAVPTTTVEVTGRVTWPDGRPGAGMHVRAIAHGETPFRFGAGVDAVADGQGQFVVMLPAGVGHRVTAFMDPDRVQRDEDYDIGAEAEVFAGPGEVVLVLRRR